MEIQEMLDQCARPRNMASEVIVIEGRLKNGVKFATQTRIDYDPGLMTTEQAIIRSLKSQAPEFNSLCIERGWQDAVWSYAGSSFVVKRGTTSVLPWKRKCPLAGAPCSGCEQEFSCIQKEEDEKIDTRIHQVQTGGC